MGTQKRKMHKISNDYYGNDIRRKKRRNKNESK